MTGGTAQATCSFPTGPSAGLSLSTSLFLTPRKPTLLTRRRVKKPVRLSGQLSRRPARSKHGPRCAAAGVDFLPMVVCTFGGWLPEGEKFVSAVARHLADHSGQTQSVVASQLWQRLSITLWRTNARIILHRAPSADLEEWDLPGYARASHVS